MIIHDIWYNFRFGLRFTRQSSWTEEDEEWD